MPKVVTGKRAEFTPYRYILSDWAGPIGVFTATSDLAGKIRKLISGKGYIETDFTILKMTDGRITTKPVRLSVYSLLKREP